MRAETGPMQFENDWSGLFIRGDNCMYFATNLKYILNRLKNQPEHMRLDDMQIFHLENFFELLNSSLDTPITGDGVYDIQKMRKFEDCCKEALVKSIIDK